MVVQINLALSPGVFCAKHKPVCQRETWVCLCLLDHLPCGCMSKRGCLSKCMLSDSSRWQRESHDSHRCRGLLPFSSWQSGWWHTYRNTEKSSIRPCEQNLWVTRGQVNFTSPHHKNTAYHCFCKLKSLSRCWSHCLGVKLSLLIVHIITYSLKHNRTHTHTRLKSLVYTPNQSKNRGKSFTVEIPRYSGCLTM